MHGVVLTSFVAFVQDRHRGLVDVVPADASYLPTEMYGDFELDRLLDHASTRTATSRDVLEREFGRYAARHSFRRLYPDAYDTSSGARDFLLNVEDRIHSLVRVSLTYAMPPKLHVVPFGATGVTITYTSDRRLCAMAEGLVTGVAEHYGETAAISHEQCMLRGDLACALFVTISGATLAP